MFIQCSSCDSKYLVNSADLKPSGRLVECANCSHQWYQKSNTEEEVLDPPVSSFNNIKEEKQKITKEIKNLPSTIVNENKVSLINSFLVLFFLFLIILFFWTVKSYGINIFVLFDYYIHEFYFNLRLIIDDLAKIIHEVIN